MTTKLDEWKYTKKSFTYKKELKKDINRGVRFLNERAYSKVAGSTRGAALFLIELRKYVDFSRVYRADFMYSRQHHYTVRLFSKDGYVIQLKGLSFGYYGEGSRGSLAALQECGFKEKQIHKLFTMTDTVRMYRRVK